MQAYLDSPAVNALDWGAVDARMSISADMLGVHGKDNGGGESKTASVLPPESVFANHGVMVSHLEVRGLTGLVFDTQPWLSDGRENPYWDGPRPTPANAIEQRARSASQEKGDVVTATLLAMPVDANDSAVTIDALSDPIVPAIVEAQSSPYVMVTSMGKKEES